MPRSSSYVPELHRPHGFAFPRVRTASEDKPIVEVDFSRPGMREALIEAVCTALELWDPVFDHWLEPSVPGDRQTPVFRGSRAHLINKFRDEIFGYMRRNHESDWTDSHFIRIADKYVNVLPMIDNGLPGAHGDITWYTREIIRPVIRRSDPEWDREAVYDARRASMRSPWNESLFEAISKMLRDYDRSWGTTHAERFNHEYAELLLQDNAPPWEVQRLVAYYVQDVFDSNWSNDPGSGLRDEVQPHRPIKKAPPHKASRRS